MSNDINTAISEHLYDQLQAILPRITPMSAAEVSTYIEEGDLEAADYLLSILEAKYADDL